MLKKQRLEAVAQAAAAMQLTQMQPFETSSSSSSSSTSSISSSSHDHSALHRLAEAAERKQVANHCCSRDLFFVPIRPMMASNRGHWWRGDKESTYV